MRKQIKLLAFCFFVVVFSPVISAQLTPADALKKLYIEYPQEKIYLWFNKTAYVAGETIWFKAYVFSDYDISTISTSLYVELYDADRKLISTKLLPLFSGVTDGNFDLDSNFNEGVYYIRAYTRWMLNFNEAFQYVHPVQVYNPASVKKLTPDNSSWKAVVMPEGGSLIDGLETKVAVRRISTAPLKSKWRGWLYEESEPANKLEEFSSLDENVALFSFIPVEGKKYLVYVKDETGNYKTVALPSVENSGVGISINDINDSITCKLSFRNIAENGKGYSLLGEIQHQLIFQADLKKTSANAFIKIPKSGQGNGILHLTVFDPEMKPVAERLVFLYQPKLNFDSSVIFQQKLSAQPRSKNELHLYVDSVNWVSYAVSVSDTLSPSSLENENILSALWLSSDLTNPIQKPAQYFIPPYENKTAALDALMISEKWTRYNWNEILNNKFPLIKYSSFNYLSYSGVVKKGKKLKADEEVNLIFSYPDSSTQIMLAKTDSTGNIFLDNLAFTGDTKIFYQINSKKNSSKFIDIDFERNNRFVPYSSPFPEASYLLAIPSSSENIPAWVTRAASTVTLEKDIENKFKTLQEVVVQSNLKTAKQELNEKLSSALFHSMNEVVFDFINEEQSAMGYTNILQWLQGRVAGLTIQFVDGNYVPVIRNSLASIYIDEMPADPQWVSSISVSDIAMIKIIKGPSVIAPLGGGGIVAIYTARGNLKPPQKTPSLPNNTLKGYDEVKKIYSPDYSNESAPKPDADKRDQLLWQSLLPPSLALDKSKVGFFNNDNATRYRIIVQGFTNKGVPVYFEKIIEPPLKAF